MNFNLLFPLTVILIILKVIELQIQNNEGYKTDRDNSQLSSSDDAYKPNFVPLIIDHEKHGASSDLDPEIFLSDNNRTINSIYGVDPPKSGQSSKSDLLYTYDKLSGPIDLGMANVMSAISKRSKESMINRSRMTKNTWSKYFVDEMNEHENRVWWDNDAELEMAF